MHPPFDIVSMFRCPLFHTRHFISHRARYLNKRFPKRKQFGKRRFGNETSKKVFPLLLLQQFPQLSVVSVVMDVTPAMIAANCYEPYEPKCNEAWPSCSQK